MKATELMIGDWVSIKPLSAYIYTRRKIKIQDFANLHKMDFVPIPLTPEILKKNGFCFVKSSDRDTVWNGWWIYKNLELGTCCLDREGNWPCCINIVDSNIECKYVHQLQHALRLCELDELADNFKL